MSDQDKAKDAKTELGDEDLDAVQGGLRLGASVPDFGNIRAAKTGYSVPGSNLMEGEEEDELQTRPNPADLSGLANFGPIDPGEK